MFAQATALSPEVRKTIACCAPFTPERMALGLAVTHATVKWWS